MISYKWSSYTRLLIIKRSFCQAHKTQWEGVVGLEIHAQIQTNSKLFSGAGTRFAALVNDQVSFFDVAIPGTLPVLNEACVKKGISTALALNCDIHKTSWFDRKHYFYSDLPAGYQITQQRYPFASNGFVEFNCYQNTSHDRPYLKYTKIKQIQLEQDSGKSLHDNYCNQSLVDLNRAGNPLMEIVFEPDLKNGDEAACLLKELMLIFKALQTCSCKIEEGALRVDANVSVKAKKSTTLGVRTEIKNIGGVSNLREAVDFEIQRQIRMCKFGKSVINETRTWDASRRITISMRDKEVVQDYRFMPEPNLPPLRLSFGEHIDDNEFINVDQLRKMLPKLPAAYRAELGSKYNLPNTTILRLLIEPKILDYFLAAMENLNKMNASKISNLLLYDFLAVINQSSLDVWECKMDPKHFNQLCHLFISKQLINRVIFRRILEILVNGMERSPEEILKQENWYQINDESILEESCKLTIEFNFNEVQAYHCSKKAKKSTHFQKLFNEALKHTHERANLQQLKEILTNLLNDTSKHDNKEC